VILDLSQRDQQVAAGPQPGEAARLPVTFGEGLEAAWHEATLFGQSSASNMARHQAMLDYGDEVRRKTGQDIWPDLSEILVNSDWSKAAATIAKLNAAQPDLHLDPPTPEEIDRRAMVLSRQARTDYQEVSAREKASGGGFGTVLGGLAGGIADPLNLATAPLFGGEGGVLLTALKFGGAAAATQTANEAIGAGYREAVQPGYLASGEPLANVLEAGASGAALGAGGKVLGIGLGRLWGRMKTGTWPTTVRDAGNLLESEAQTQATNVYPGVAGEAAHRDALSAATDQIIKGEPVDVAAHITPEVEARQLGIRSELNRLFNDEIDPSNLSKEAADLWARMPPDIKAAGFDVVGNSGKVDGFLTESDILDEETVAALRKSRKASTESSANKFEEWLKQNLPKLDFESVRQRATTATEAAQAARAAEAGPAPELPFEATAAEAQAETVRAALRDRIAQIAEAGGHVLSHEEIAALADRFARMTPEDAADAARQLRVVPHQLAAEPPAARTAAVAEPPATAYPQAAVDQMLASPEHAEALRGDLDRARATADVKIPAGVDPEGNPIFRSLDSALDEVDAFKKAADEIQACAAPAQQEAAE